jgi:hypothetical protein
MRDVCCEALLLRFLSLLETNRVVRQSFRFDYSHKFNK